MLATREVFFTRARLVSVSEVRCDMPFSILDIRIAWTSITWLVSVSNDNVTFSNQTSVFIFDSKCLDCADDASSCQQKVRNVWWFVENNNDKLKNTFIQMHMLFVCFRRITVWRKNLLVGRLYIDWQLRNFVIFSERTTLRSLYAISRPSVVCCLSVVCLSVCDVGAPYSGGWTFRQFFHHTIAQGLYFSGAKNRWWGRPFPPEIFVQRDRPPF